MLKHTENIQYCGYHSLIHTYTHRTYTQDHDNATTYTAKEIEKCMLLSMKVLFGYEADVDIIELAKSSRGFVSCPIAENKKYLTMVGCYKRTCKEYERGECLSFFITWFLSIKNRLKN